MSGQKLFISFNGSWQTSSPYSLERMPEFFHFHYQPFLTFQNTSIERYIRKNCSRAERRNHIPKVSIWLGQYHKQDLLSGAIPDIAVCWIHPRVGYGVFARRDFPAWAFIGEYVGAVRSLPLVNPLINDYCFRYPLPMWSCKRFTIDSEQQGNFTRFLNHSDTPNVESIGVLCNGVYHVILRTTRIVKAGEELCYHYGDLYWKYRRKVP